MGNGNWRRWVPVIAIAWAASAAVPALAQSKHRYTDVQEAFAAARDTGRLIVAISTIDGGHEISDDAVIEVERRLARPPLNAKYIQLVFDVRTSGGQGWMQRFSTPNDLGVVPSLYVIRADLKKLYVLPPHSSGPIKAVHIDRTLKVFAKDAGLVLDDSTAAKLKLIVQEATAALHSNDHQLAVELFAPLKKLGKLGSLGSFAKPAMDADELAAKLIEKGRQELHDSEDALFDDPEDFETAMRLATVSRVYQPLIQEEVKKVVRKARKNAKVKVPFKQAEQIDRAIAMLPTKNGTKKANKALRKVVSRYPGTPAADYVEKRFEQLVGEPLNEADPENDKGNGPAVADAEKIDTAVLRTWTSKNGQFTIRAKLIGVKEQKAGLEMPDGTVKWVPLDKLSDEDIKFLGG